MGSTAVRGLDECSMCGLRYNDETPRLYSGRASSTIDVPLSPALRALRARPLKRELTLRDITLWSSGLVKRQQAHHKSGILEDAIRAVQLVLIILSPHSRGSAHVRHARDLARHFKRPVCEVWIEGESLQQCLPDFYGEPGVVIDARQGEESALLNQIATTIERV